MTRPAALLRRREWSRRGQLGNDEGAGAARSRSPCRRCKGYRDDGEARCRKGAAGETVRERRRSARGDGAPARGGTDWVTMVPVPKIPRRVAFGDAG
jgi:hypothetical protein